MSLVRLVNVSKYVGARKLFGPVTVSIESGDRIGLIGRNGTGKTTLLRLIAGLDAPDEGSVTRAAKLQMGYLAQETGTLEPGDTPYNIVLRSLEHLTELAAELRRCEEAMQRSQSSEHELERLMERYAMLSERFEREGGYEMDARVRSVLLGLGLEEEQLHQEVSTLSGGERERVALAALLVKQPDFLILDEPTNHLDIAAVEWLEQYLRNYRGAFLVVSHDRAFLDAVAQRIWEIDAEGIAVYRGNFSAAQVQRQERLARLAKEYEAQQEEIARLEAYVRRYRAGTRATQARSREKRLERMERLERPTEDAAAMKLAIQSAAVRGSREVVRFEGVSHRYNGTEVLRDLHFTVERGQRVGIVGPNGSGKTTLLELLTLQMTPTEGNVYLGRDIVVGYYRQHFEGLDPERTILDEILSVRHMTLQEARSYLARFLFRGDDVFKQVGVLSGGESRRLMLAKLLLSPVNLLCLDEPTNHLDIPSREALEEALDTYTGTLIFVSHDRYFLSRLADRLIVLGKKPGEWQLIDRGYDAWRRLEAAKAQAQAAAKRGSARSPRTSDAERRAAAQTRAAMRAAKEAVRKLEAQIEALEAEKTELETMLADPRLYDDPDRMREVTLRYREVTQTLDEAYEAWSEQAEQLEVEPS